MHLWRRKLGFMTELYLIKPITSFDPVGLRGWRKERLILESYTKLSMENIYI